MHRILRGEETGDYLQGSEVMEKVTARCSQVPQRPCKGDWKQVDDTLKVIPPKVYITDSSSFKKLVQELTGNGRHVSTSPSPPPMQEKLHDHVPIISTKEHDLTGNGRHVSTSSLPPPMQEKLLDHVPIISTKEHDKPEVCRSEGQESNNSQASAIPVLSPLLAFTALQTGWINQQADEFQYQGLNALSMEIDQFPFCDGYGLPDDDFFPYQYDLSELSDIL